MFKGSMGPRQVLDEWKILTVGTSSFMQIIQKHCENNFNSWKELQRASCIANHSSWKPLLKNTNVKQKCLTCQYINAIHLWKYTNGDDDVL